jgi:hypothetical protein
MAHSEARAWWTEVEHLRDGFERGPHARRQADRDDLAARRARRELDRIEAEIALPARRFAREPVATAPAVPRGTALLAPPAAGPDALGAGAAPAPAHRPDVAAPRPAAARRTVQIRGHAVPAPAVPRLVEVERRRAPRRPAERMGQRPDRLALWALLMGIVLILVAVGTADAATLAG